jgi:hypothetical protein
MPLLFTKPFLIVACIAGFSALPQVSSARPACPARVEANVEVAGREFSLADLLARDTCPTLLRAAGRVRLGSAPLTGSARVLEAGEVRSLLQKVARSIPNGVRVPTSMVVPERVTVRRAGERASCADIGRRLLGPVAAPPALARSGFVRHDAARQELECGVADRIPQASALERTRTVWNPALNSWDVSLRCVRPEDCVPFLVRLRDRDAPSEIAPFAPPATRKNTIANTSPFHAVRSAAGAPLVRRGETVRLLWDQYGVRLAVPAISLDSGDEGQKVQARIVRGGRIVPAIVVSAGELRTAF